MKVLVFAAFVFQFISTTWATGYYHDGQLCKVISKINSGVLEFDDVEADKKEALLSKERLFYQKKDLKSKYLIINEGLTQNKINNLKKSQIIKSVKKLYTNNLDGTEFSIKNEILLKLKTTATEKQVLDLLSNFNPQIFKRNTFGPNTLAIRIDVIEEENVFDAANYLFENGLVDFAHPNFTTYNCLETNDTYYSNQWNLSKISASSAWSISTGSSSVKIAILDNGVESNHDDLSNNVVTGRDIVGGDNTTEPYGNYFHGTAVAGIASAVTNNSEGIAGVGYNCSIMPIQISYTNAFDSDDVADGITWAYNNDADIINLSGQTTTAAAVNNAITNAAQYGRNGKGCVFVKSAGNSSGSITFPGEHEKAICVGAIESDDDRYLQCSFGSALDVMAPNHVYSTDLEGSAGANDAANGDYYNSYGGTSFSAPHVSGLAGLMISNNSSLTESQIRDIICKTADDLGDTGFDIYFGWGRINAYHALLATNSPTTSGTLGGDEVWYGAVTLTGDVIVPSNVELRILRGATISIPSGKKIQVYGTLKAVGTSGEQITFDRSGSSNWYGIKFEDSSDDSECILDNCVIKHCSYAVYCNHAAPTIRNCEISYSMVGLYGYYCNSLQPVQGNLFKYNSLYGALLSHPQAVILSNNDFINYGTNIKCYYSDYSTTLRGNDVTQSGASAQGILFDHSSPIVIENMIYNNNRYGVNCINTSSPEFVHEDVDGENNVIADNALYGVVADGSSLPKLSDLSVADTAYNSIYSNRGSYDVYNSNATSIPAHGNWWGQNPPNTSRFYGGVDWTNPLSEDPNPTPQSLGKSSAGEMAANAAASGDVNKEAREIFERGYAFELKGEWRRAIDEYDVVVDKYPDATEALMALVHAGLCYDKLGQSESRKSEIAVVASTKADYEVGGLAALLDAQEDMKEKRGDDALAVYKDVAQRFPGSVLAQQALYDEWGVYFNVKGDESAARQDMEAYEKQFGEDETFFAMKAAMGELTEEMLKRLEKPGSTSEASLPKAFALHANYPNPFNPSTHIPYDLPEASAVRLEIVNVLGQRIVLLLDERREAGRYEIVWDGRTAAGIKAAAGLYFCRMTAGDFSRTIKMTLLP